MENIRTLKDTRQKPNLRWHIRYRYKKIRKFFNKAFGDLFVGAAYAVLTRLPYATAKKQMERVMRLYYRFDRRHRNIAVDQIMQCLEMNKTDAEKLARESYRNFSLYALETATAHRMSLEEAVARVDMRGLDDLMRQLLSHGKGLLIITGHLGNWEMGAIATGYHKGATNFIAKPMGIGKLDAMLTDLRQRSGCTVWLQKGSIRRMLEGLRNGEGVCVLLDQDGSHTGCAASFFNRIGSCQYVPIDVAIRCGAPIVVAGIMRSDADMHFHAAYCQPHWPDPAADRLDERLRLLTLVNHDLEAIIRKYPEQWLWFHRRWKTRFENMQSYENMTEPEFAALREKLHTLARETRGRSEVI